MTRGADRRCLARVLLDPWRGRGRHRHHPQPEADADALALRGAALPLGRHPGAARDQGGGPGWRPADRDRRPQRAHRDGQRGGPPQAAGPDQARSRLRRRRQELRRVDGHRLDPGGLCTQPGATRQLPRRVGAPRAHDRLRAPDARGVDQRHDPSGGGRVARRHAAQGPPRHLHRRRGEPARRVGDGRGRRADRHRRAAVEDDRRPRPVGALGQLSEERQHPHPARPGSQERERHAGDQELRQEVARGAAGVACLAWGLRFGMEVPDAPGVSA